MTYLFRGLFGKSGIEWTVTGYGQGGGVPTRAAVGHRGPAEGDGEAEGGDGAEISGAQGRQFQPAFRRSSRVSEKLLWIIRWWHYRVNPDFYYYRVLYDYG